MSNLVSMLFAVVDSDVWDASQVSEWAKRLSARLDRPKDWLNELRTCTSTEICLGLIRRVMNENGMVLPSDIGELMAGLTLLAFDDGRLSADEARAQLVDIIDAYGAAFVDAEAAGSLALDDKIYSEMRARAEDCIRYLTGEQLVEVERGFLEA